MSGKCSGVLRLYLSKYAVSPIFRHSVVPYRGSSGTIPIQDESAKVSHSSSNKQIKPARRVGHHTHGQKGDRHGSDTDREQKLDPEWFNGKQNVEKKKKRADSTSSRQRSRVNKEWLQETQSKNDHSRLSFQEDLKVTQSEEPYGVGGDSAPEHGVFFKPIHHDKGAQEMFLAQVPEQPPDPHLLKVAIIGTPNTGKSTLINSLLGRRIFSVSGKVHTTRSKAFAVFNQDNRQIIILDTPGIVDYKKARRHKLARPLLVDHRNSLLEADLVAVMVDASHERGKRELHFEILKQLCLHPHLKSILILNKIDLVKPQHKLHGITASLTCGKVGGRSFEVSPDVASKLGSLERRSFMKLSYRPPPVDKLEDCDSDKFDLKNDHKYWWETNGENRAALEHKKSSVWKDNDATDNIIPPQDEEIGSNKKQLTDHDIPDEGDDVSSLDDRTTCGVDPNDSMPDPITDCGALDRSSSESTPHRTEPDEMPSDGSSQEEHKSKDDIMKEYINNMKEAGGGWLFEMSPEAEKAKKEERMKEKQAEKELHHRVAKMDGWNGFDAVFMVSAKQGVGIKDLKNYLLDEATPRDWEYHSDVVTSLSPEEVVKEAIREQLLKLLFEEVPYLVQQKNVIWEMGEGGELHIVQDLVCPKASHARLIESRIGAIATRAQQQLMNAFHHEVRLVLQVSVDKKLLRRLGR
ncbi:GTPase Era, mitochondrial-like [Amphiura filiformis]|uniref:GTPase Era, mitochondrial-like n=1 Tax=Amphiura filiformis TaxID=82378 RepID=UPI003B219AB1